MLSELQQTTSAPAAPRIQSAFTVCGKCKCGVPLAISTAAEKKALKIYTVGILNPCKVLCVTRADFSVTCNTCDHDGDEQVAIFEFHSYFNLYVRN